MDSSPRTGIGRNGGKDATWAALLGRWTEFAQAAKSLPTTGEGRAWRESVAPVIGLQAVTFALGEFGTLPAAEQARALDLAEVVIRKHAAELHDAWSGVELPDKLAELISDARESLEIASELSAVWINEEADWVAGDIGSLIGTIARDGFAGDLFGLRAGTVLMRGAPKLIIRPHFMFAGLNEETRAAVDRWCGSKSVPHAAVQVYRQIDESSGRIARDVIAPMRTSLLPGRPLLECLMERGKVVGRVESHDAAAWEAAQRSAMPEGGIPVVMRDGAD